MIFHFATRRKYRMGKFFSFQNLRKLFSVQQKISELLLMEHQVCFCRYKTNETIKIAMVDYPQLSNENQFGFKQLSRTFKT